MPSRCTPEHGAVWKVDQEGRPRAGVEHGSFLLYQRTTAFPSPHKEQMLQGVSSGLQFLGSAIYLLYHLSQDSPCVSLSLDTKWQQY